MFKSEDNAREYFDESFRIGALSRDQLEDECIEKEIDFDKHTPSYDLRSLLLESFTASQEAK